ncbi:hypothetical protein CH375_06595 [Leptospira ellisii]|uniref:Uncharacterized protein n=1 Tax=Leptospira ellisii TaxID=2023197 RepID=A0A2N0B8G6_9LEPT|nr:hypothetical protein CH379_11155 [Leptospira ellisii]PKA05193.1 hypothetical protein CH375_06595 [Leptospira ellisii]
MSSFIRKTKGRTENNSNEIFKKIENPTSDIEILVNSFGMNILEKFLIKFQTYLRKRREQKALLFANRALKPANKRGAERDFVPARWQGGRAKQCKKKQYMTFWDITDSKKPKIRINS